jgi:hypothetical protein
MAQFPNRLAPIRRATSAYDVWFTLLEDLEGAYRESPPSIGVIDSIWRFAAWCFDPHRHRSVRNAVAVGFYEHLPHFGPARRDLPQRVSRDAFLELLSAFRTTLTDAEFREFVSEYLEAQGAARPEIRKILASAT